MTGSPDDTAELVHTTRKAAGRKASKKSESTRQQILDAAAAVLAEKGYSLARLNDISGRAGMHLSALYYYYDNKEALVVDLLTQVSLRAAQTLRDALATLPADTGGRERLRVAIRAYLQALFRQDDYGRAFPRVISQLSLAAREKAVAVTREQSAIWARLLADARRSGELRSDLDPTLLRMTLLGALNWSVEWFQPDLGSVERFADTVAEVFLDGAAARPADE